jgi:hypothetical protein
VKWSRVKISVVVAFIQTSYLFKILTYPKGILDGRALKTVVGKVFLRVALMQKLVGPKCQVKTIKQNCYDRHERDSG